MSRSTPPSPGAGGRGGRPGSGGGRVRAPVSPPGAETEVDFADLWVRLKGQMTKCFPLRMSHSGRAVHRVFASQGQEAFLDGPEGPSSAQQNVIAQVFSKDQRYPIAYFLPSQVSAQ